MMRISHILVQACIPKQVMNSMLCYFMKRMPAEKKPGIPRVRRHFILVTYHESLQMKNRLLLVSPLGKALCLLKTQFAKKPKNPV